MARPDLVPGSGRGGCDPHVLAIPGTGNQDHLVANVAAGTLRLSEQELTLLEAVTAAAEPA